MRKNNLYTKSYFIKRLIGFGYFVSRIVENYPDNDIRYWSVYVRDIENNTVLITCVKKKDSAPDDFYFRINGPNDSNIKLETLSMNIVAETIENLFNGVDKLKITLED
jgi:hypothetical protein